MKTIYFFAFITVIAFFSLVEAGVYPQGLKQNYQSEGQSGYYAGAQAKYYKTNQKLTETTASKKLDSVPAQRLYVTAWGIILIIIGIIILSTITYYVFILYPYICKKERTYDIMELTDVNSVCIVSDNANMPLYRNSNDISNDVPVNH